MIELKAGRYGIVAIPYKNGRGLKPVKLPDGAIVEKATKEQVDRDIPRRTMVANLGIDAEGNALTDADYGRGKREEVFLGVHPELFLLSSGHVAAVYGAVIEEIGSDDDDA